MNEEALLSGLDFGNEAGDDVAPAELAHFASDTVYGDTVSATDVYCAQRSIRTYTRRPTQVRHRMITKVSSVSGSTKPSIASR